MKPLLYKGKRGWFVVMYLRFTQRTNADGTTVRYAALAHNRRVEGTTRPDVLMNLGRVDQLDVDGLRRLAASIDRHFGDGGLDDAARDAGVHAGAAPMEVVDARPIGAIWLLDALWRRLEIGSAIKAASDGRRFTTGVERVLFALVANRAIAPMSKLSAADWVVNDALISGLTAMTDDHAYRAMDLLVEADAQAEVQESVFSRDDLPQIVIGLAVTREGIPVRCFVWPGNTNDQTVLAEVKDAMRDWKPGRVVTVVDRGFSSADNLAYLRRAGGHYIAGMPMRNGNALVEQVLSRQGRYQQVKDNLRVKEVRIDGTDTRFVLCHNPDQQVRDAAKRTEAITRIEAELARIADQRARDKNKTLTDKAKARNEEAHLRAECALRHPTLGRWLRQQATGRLVIDKTKVKAEERLDGKYLLATSDPDISAEDTALGYKALLEAERGFRDMKSELLLRPVFHRLDHRIRAHVLICWLALLLVRVAERTSGQTWRQINRETSRLKQVTLAGPAGTIVQTTPLRPEQKAIYQALSITPPPRMSVFEPS